MRMFFNILFVRLRFLLVFIVIGLIVGNWSFIQNVFEKLTGGQAQVSVQGEFEWYCPMHPSVVRGDPGEKCPICGMPLSKRKRGERPKGQELEISLTETRVQQAGLATEEVVYRTLVREIRTVGFIEYDERRLAHITARTAGRIDKLFADFTGMTVKKGDPLVWIYSPELVSTQEEYLLAWRALEQIQSLPPQQQSPGAVERARRAASSARERLALWGMTEEQLKALELSGKVETHVQVHSPIDGTVIARHVLAGQYVGEGAELYEVADLSWVWVQAEVFESDVGLVKLGQAVEVSTEAYPAERFTGAVSFVAPTVQAQTRTLRIRMDVNNDGQKLKPGMYVNATLRIPIGRQGEVFYGCCASCPDVRSDVPGTCPRCKMELVKQGGVKVEHEQDPRAPSGGFVYKCLMDGAIIDKPGPCPKCGMALDERHKVPKEPESKQSRSIFVCEAHPEEVFDTPGRCKKDT